jgi:LPS-assembly protein
MRRTPIFLLSSLLPALAGAGEAINYARLGWMDKTAIAAKPAAERPPVNASCRGTWVTPIPISTKVGKPDESPVEGEAAWVYFDPDGASKLRGNVRISQPGRTIQADNAEISTGRDNGRFTGNILLAEPGLVLSGHQADMNLAGKTAHLETVEFVSTLLNAHGKATSIDRKENGELRFDKVEYSTCEPDHRVWYFSARKLKLDPTTGRGTVRQARLHIMGVPLVNIPYFNFPIDDRRMTGLLVPRFGTTNDGGFDFAQPVYINLAPNYDLTLTPRLLSRRGVMAESEFRYLLDGKGSGELQLAMLPSDKLYQDEDRQRASWRHRYQENHVRLATLVNYVSDNAFFTDLGTDLTQSGASHQERTGEVEYYGDTWSLLGRVQGFQTIDPLLQDISKPYARLPQMLFRGGLPLEHDLSVSLLGEMTRFSRTVNDGSGTEVNGARWRLEPRVDYRLERPWGFVAPELKLRQLAYKLDGAGSSPDIINTPVLSLDSGLTLERDGGRFLQTLEPRVFYVYSPYTDQSALPNFDTATSTFSFAQLFRSSRFSGGDRIDDANQVSLGITSRWLDRDDGRERLRASLGEVFYLRDRKVRLNATDPVASSGTSGVAGELALQWNREWSGSADTLWTPDAEAAQFGLQIHYLPESTDRLFNIGYSYRRDITALNQKALSQASASVIHPLSARWGLMGLVQYDLDNDLTQDSLVGLRYDACCWRVSLYQRQFLTDPDDISAAKLRRSAFFIEVTLKGLAGISSGVNDLLSNKVFGYNQIQDSFRSSFRENR